MPGIARGVPAGVTPWGRGDGVVVEAVFNGQVIARSDNTVVVEDNHYFPPKDVRMEYLTRSRAKTLCPWKGIASYYTITVSGASDATPHGPTGIPHRSPAASRTTSPSGTLFASSSSTSNSLRPEAPRR